MELNEGLKELGEGAFFKSAIETITLPSTLKRVEMFTFAGCKNLKSVEILKGVEHIGEGCFKGSLVEEITLPCTLKGIGTDAFAYCPNLRTVWVEEGCTVDVRKYVSQNVDVRRK